LLVGPPFFSPFLSLPVMDWIPLMLKLIMRMGDCSELLVPIDAMDAVSSRDHVLQFFNFKKVHRYLPIETPFLYHVHNETA
jgi:hypothetical protein